MYVRLAQFEDIPGLCDLLAVLFAQEAEFRPDPKAQEEGLRQIIEGDDVGHILVLHEGTRILGMVSLLYTISTALGGRVAMVEDMVVHPDCRSDGNGSMLLRRAIQFAKQQGCRRLTLLTDGVNAGAIRFYQRHGFALSGMVPMRLLL